MTQKALTDRKVLDCSQFVAGPYCARILADMGADVIKVEPPSGDIARTKGPFPDHISDPEKSGLFLYLNFNKSGITLNLESSKGQDVFKQLIKDTDILIEDNPPGKMKQLGLDYENLQKVNPNLIMTSITPFGLTGFHKDYQANYMTLFHASGLGVTTPPEPQWGKKILEREPCREGGFCGEYDCGVMAAVGILAALFARRTTGRGQFIEISQQEALMQMSRVEIAYYFECKISQRRDDAKYLTNFNYLYPTKDGWVALMHQEPHHWKALMEMMGNPEWANDPRYADMGGRALDWMSFWDNIAQWSKNYTKDELSHGYQAKGGPGGSVLRIDEVPHTEQMKEREFFVEIDHPKAGKLPYASTYAKYGAWPWEVLCPAPLLGQHNKDIYCKKLGLSSQELSELKKTGVV